MFKYQIYLIASLALWSAFAATAEEYVVPEGIKVLTEEQLLNRVIGNTFYTPRWQEYYEPPVETERKGKLRIQHKKYGLHSGTWSIEASLMCWEYEKLPLSQNGGCYTIALEEDNATFFNTDGSVWYPLGGRIKQKMGNPNNL